MRDPRSGGVGMESDHSCRLRYVFLIQRPVKAGPVVSERKVGVCDDMRRDEKHIDFSIPF